FFTSSRRHTRSKRDWSSDVCSSDLVGPERFEISAPSVKLPPLSALVIGSSRDTLQVAHELRNLHTSAARVPWHMVTLRPHPTLTPPPNTELAALRVHATSPPLHELGALHGGLSCILCAP